MSRVTRLPYLDTLQKSPASALTPADAAPTAPTSPRDNAVGANLSSGYEHADFLARMERTHGGYVPSWTKSEADLLQGRIAGYINGERVSLAEQRAQEERFLAEPQSEYRDAWLTSTRSNIVCSEKMIAAWEAQLAEMAGARLKAAE